MSNMRVGALIISIYVAVLAVVILSAGCSAQNPIPFRLIGATQATYREFIRSVRESLTSRAQVVNGKPVLPQNTTVLPRDSFILVDLTDYDSKTVTVAIYVVNVYVVAFHAAGDPKSYFLDDIPAAANATLFPGTEHTPLNFTGSYPDLGNRSNVDLGPTALNAAIDGLRRNQNVKKSLIVIIQMVSEAARFRLIAARVSNSIHTLKDFIPDEPILRLENNWGALSKGVQTAVNGVFRDIKLLSVRHQEITVNSIEDPFLAAVALFLFECRDTTTTNGTTIPADAVVGRVAFGQSTVGETCQLEAQTTRISGREGMCVDVRDGRDTDRTPIQLSACGQASRQQWTFQLDRTVRSLGKCMTLNSSASGSGVVLFNCSTVPVQDGNKWTLSADGTITNPRSGLVLTAQRGDSGTTLTVETNTYSAGQGWRPVSLQAPSLVAAYPILGYNDMCLQAQVNNSAVWLEDCVQNRDAQQWRLYNDGTIRVNSALTRCVTSNGRSSGVAIIISNCQGLASQRWVFQTGGTLLNPNANLVMDVKNSNVTLKEIILSSPTGNPNQQWLPLFI